MKKHYVFYFGKYKGKTVQEVIDKDINYIKWLEKEKGIKFDFKIPLNDDIVEITQTKDNFAWGKLANLSFTAKVLNEDDKVYGINGSRVIKLNIIDNYTKQEVLNYDRGWDIKPKKEYQKAYKTILKKLNNLSYIIIVKNTVI